MPLIPTLERQRQADLCEFVASLVYIIEFYASEDFIVRLTQKK